jgi:predicted PolB exonuclease-like 3'-5' exonuclease
MAKTLGLPSPKEELDGSRIYQTYYAENNLQSIADYCKKDVLTLMNVYLRLKLLQALPAEQVVNLP